MEWDIKQCVRYQCTLLHLLLHADDYYTPTNEDWDGKFRKFKVTIAENNLHLSYRAGYYGREENAEAVRDDRAAETAQPDLDEDATAPVVSTTPALAAPAGLAETAPEDSLNPMPIVFKVTVDPAAAPDRRDASSSPGNAESKAERRQGDRGYTLHFFVAATGLRLVHEPASEQIPGQGAYSTRLEIMAVSYMNGHLADENSIQVSAAFDGPADPRVAKGAITASLKVQVPKKGKRLIWVTVRDVFSGQFGRLDIPVEKIALP